jgi:hypothetical protein
MRHAIETSFITPVGDRHSQVIDSMTKSILHFTKLRSAEILCNWPDAGIVRLGHWISPVIDEPGIRLKMDRLGGNYGTHGYYPFNPYFDSDLIDYQIPYKTAFFERALCTGWEYDR